MAVGHLKSRTGLRKRGVERDIAVTATDGTTLLVDHHPPRTKPDASGETSGAVVWIRTPYGRKGMHPIANKFVTRGAHVLVEALRGTDGSGGTFDGIALNPSDGADVAAWLRRQPWFPGTIVTWGISVLGYASWALAARESRNGAWPSCKTPSPRSATRSSTLAGSSLARSPSASSRTSTG